MIEVRDHQVQVKRLYDWILDAWNRNDADDFAELVNALTQELTEQIAP